MADKSNPMEVSELDNVENIVELDDQQLQELEKQSTPFLGQWEKLISTTNWEKGAVIVEWRKAMEKVAKKSDLPKGCFSDEQWSRLCGGATPQHIGRLRRTFERFGHVYQEYEGLYWSHFYAALDWDDAEMWLEGAVQNDWSVSKMRNSRWETMGKRPGEEPRIEQIVVSELDEESRSVDATARLSDRDREVAEGPIHEGPDFGDSDDGASGKKGKSDSVSADVDEDGEPTGPKIRPFESFTDLPDDIAEAASAFKIAIIKHKADEWNEFSKDELFGLLDALKSLAIAASE